MRFTVSGHVLDLDPVSARARLAGHPPEPIQVHWVALDGQRWPPKQALEIICGLQRSAYISLQALGVLRRLGFETSEWLATPRVSAAGDVAAVISAEVSPQDAATLRVQLREAVEVLADFMGSQKLTDRISSLELQLVGASIDEVVGIVEVAGVSRDTLKAALTVRSTMGRLNDVVHATVIALSLQRILEPGESVSNRPSLAAGNDPSRKFDLETTHRVAEYKVSVWRGADAMRKRGAFADLVNLAPMTRRTRRSSSSWWAISPNTSSRPPRVQRSGDSADRRQSFGTGLRISTVHSRSQSPSFGPASDPRWRSSISTPSSPASTA